jgi:hypothetical protein
LNIIKYIVLPTQLKIAITKKSLNCKNCGNENEADKIHKKCAVAFVEDPAMPTQSATKIQL